MATIAAAAFTSALPTLANATTSPVAVQHECGKLPSGAVTWSPAQAKVYVVTCAVTITGSTKLTLAAGTIVKFTDSTFAVAPDGTGEVTGGGSLTGTGSLTAAGTAAAPVTFTSYEDDTVGGDTNGNGPTNPPTVNELGPNFDFGTWNSLSASTLSLSHTVVKYTSYIYGGSAAAAAAGGADDDPPAAAAGPVSVTDSTFSNGSALSVSTTKAITIEGNHITGCAVGSFAAAIDVVGVTPIVKSNAVSNCTDWLSVGPIVALNATSIDASQLSGNTAAGTSFDAIAIRGTLTKSATVPTTGPLWRVDDVLADGCNDCFLTVAKGATLTFPAGATLAFGFGDGYVPSSGLGTALRVAGAVIANGTTAAPVVIDGSVDVRSGGTAALHHVTLQTANYGAPQLLSEAGAGAVAAQADLTSQPEGPGQLLVSAATGTTIDARNSWWGTSTGPVAGNTKGNVLTTPFLAAKP